MNFEHEPILISRRSFLEASILAGAQLSAAGLLLGLHSHSSQAALLQAKTGMAKSEDTDTSGVSPNVFVHIAPDGMVTIICHRSEMGQGIRSSIPVLIADELGADMKHVKIVQADGDSVYGDQNTDGSNSIRGFYEDLRRVAATARMMLVEAAARQWKVSPDSCVAEEHFVRNKSGEQKLGFGELANLARKSPVPKVSEVKLRPNSELRYVGKQLPLIDGPAYVTGTALFGADIRLPGMLIAIIARPPVVGGTVAHFNPLSDGKAALTIRGVKHVIQIPAPKAPYGFQFWGGIAVLAENTWSAKKGRDALQIKWNHGKNETYDSGKFREELLRAVRTPGKIVRNLGDVDATIKLSQRTLDGEYYVPHLPHVSMEPPVALARFEKGHCEIWA
ncbi:MAG: molybdopterin cofactor-binding domain-containing protein, partial [Bdellovibrionia bacterium]